MSAKFHVLPAGQGERNQSGNFFTASADLVLVVNRLFAVDVNFTIFVRKMKNFFLLFLLVLPAVIFTVQDGK